MKHLFRFSLLLLALLLPAAAAAHDFEVGGIYYNINGDEATVTFRGTYTHSYSDEYTGDVAIPSAVTYSGTTYAVTAIGERAFLFCDEVTSMHQFDKPHRGKRQLSLRFPQQLQCHYRDGEQYIDSGLPELRHSPHRHRHR